MADDKTKKGPKDASKINVNESWELEYWTKKFGVTADVLKKAVKDVGVEVEKVKKKLGKK
jgi:hypothetical protein